MGPGRALLAPLVPNIRFIYSFRSKYFAEIHGDLEIVMNCFSQTVREAIHRKKRIKFGHHSQVCTALSPPPPLHHHHHHLHLIVDTSKVCLFRAYINFPIL